MRSAPAFAAAVGLCACTATSAGAAPLHEAAAARDVGRVKQLLAAGEDVLAPNAEGKDAVRVAAEAGHAGVAGLLSDAGAGTEE